MKPALGQVYRDTYYDGKQPNCTKRTVRVVRVETDAVRVEQVTNVRGEKPKGKARNTRISFKTLAKGFVLTKDKSAPRVEQADACFVYADGRVEQTTVGFIPLQKDKA